VFDDINDCVAAWEYLYKNIIKEMVPEMKAKIRSKSVPWITSEIRKLMNKRYKLLKKFRQSKDKNDWDLYKKARNSITKLLRETEADYWCKEFREAKNTKEFWSLVRKVQNTDVRPRIGALQVGDDIITDDKQKAEKFNKFFSCIGIELSEKFTQENLTSKTEEHIYRIAPGASYLTLQEASSIKSAC